MAGDLSDGVGAGLDVPRASTPAGGGLRPLRDPATADATRTRRGKPRRPASGEQRIDRRVGSGGIGSRRSDRHRGVAHREAASHRVDGGANALPTINGRNEQQGLPAPERLPSGYRVYSESDVETVRRIRCLLAAGLPTTLIAQVLPCVRADDDRLVPTCPDLVARLERERERITQVIRELQASGTMLDTVITAAPR
jgi:DNA-binding transcriptional MerR regulator